MIRYSLVCSIVFGSIPLAAAALDGLDLHTSVAHAIGTSFLTLISAACGLIVGAAFHEANANR